VVASLAPRISAGFESLMVHHQSGNAGSIPVHENEELVLSDIMEWFLDNVFMPFAAFSLLTFGTIFLCAIWVGIILTTIKLFTGMGS